MIVKALMALSVSFAVQGQQSSLDEPDWFADLESIDANDIDAPSPWYGSISADNLVAQDADAMGTQNPRRQFSLLAGWQGKINSDVTGQFNAELILDSEEFSNSNQETAQSNSFEINESFVDWKISPTLSLKAGRQKIGVGNAQSVRVLDTISPLDTRIPGYGNLEQLKIPVTTFSFSLNHDPVSHRIILTPEQRKDTVYQSGVFTQPSGDQEFNNIELDRGLYALSYQGSILDWQVLAGRIFNPQQQLGQSGPYFQSEDMVGVLMGITNGPVRVFTEASSFSVNQTWPQVNQTHDGTSILLGINYTGIQSVQLQMEAYRKVLYDSDFLDERIFLRGQYQTFRDTLTLKSEATLITSADALLVNTGVDYDWKDGWQFSAGLLNYHAEKDSSFNSLNDHDFIYLAAEYHW